MQAKPPHSSATRPAVTTAQFPPLELENRPAVSTAQASHYLSRRPQTLRMWACFENGPIRPIRINGRLAWPVGEIKRLLGLEVA